MVVVVCMITALQVHDGVMQGPEGPDDANGAFATPEVAAAAGLVAAAAAGGSGGSNSSGLRQRWNMFRQRYQQQQRQGMGPDDAGADDQEGEPGRTDGALVLHWQAQQPVWGGVGGVSGYR
jgi:hypothetical protein